MLRHFARTLPLLLALSFAAPAPVQAQADVGLSPADEILSTLRSRGYAIVENERTWLGRQRIVALKDGITREVVFIPATGEILRDYAIRPDEHATSQLAGDGGDAANSATGGVALGISGGSADPTPSVSVGESLGTLRGADIDTSAVGDTQ
jgi:hypothetical protein